MVGEDDGYRHSKWLSFIEKRLQIAKELLNEDGIIFISIDDNEQANLKILSDLVFGEQNFVTQFVWEKTQHFGRQKVNYYSNCEYVLCYCKKIYNNKENRIKELLVEKIKTELTDAPLFNASNREQELIFKKGTVKFNIPDGEYDTSDNEKYILASPVMVLNGTNKNNLVLKFKSRWSQKTVDIETQKGTRFWIKSEGFAIRAIYTDDKIAKESPKQMIFTNANNPLCAYSRFGTKVGVNEEGSNELKRIITQSRFSYPKPTSFVKYLINLLYDYKKEQHMKDFVILDFFAGSGTTGHAVVELNKEDEGNRRYILCTNNENNICEEVTYQRLKNIQKELPHNLIYYKTDFVSRDEEFLSDALLEHVCEMIQVENGIKIDGKKYVALLNDNDADDLEAKWDKNNFPERIYISREVLLSTKQTELFDQAEMQVIPDYYFDFELKEAGESW